MSIMDIITNYHWVPLDVVECILRKLADVDDMSSLKACCFVCRDFTPLCQKHIFADITLSNFISSQNIMTSMHLLEVLLKSKPQLSNYIRTLRYEHHTNSGMPEPFIFRHLPYVTTFYLSFRAAAHIPSWSTVSPSFKETLFSFLSSNNIIRWALEYINDIPGSIFGYVPGLRSLTTNWVTLDSESLTKVDSQLAAPKLQSLFAERGGKRFVEALLLPQLRSSINFTLLEDFRLCLDYVEPGAEIIKGIIGQSHKLKSIYLNGSPPLLDMCNNLLSCLHPESWKTLKLINLGIELDNEDQDPYCHLSTELAKMSGANVLEEISLSICIVFDSRCTTELKHWSHLGEVLSRNGGFTSLREVKVEVVICHFSSDPRELESKMHFIRDNAFSTLSTWDQVDFTMTVETCLI